MRIKNSILFIALVLILSLSCYAQKKDMMNLSINVTLKNLSFGDYIPAKISTTNAKQQNSKIKYRGNSSAGYDKKSFSIKFQEKVAFKQLDSSYKWKLNADYIDKTLMRNKLSYDLFKAFSEKNISPKTSRIVVIARAVRRKISKHSQFFVLRSSVYYFQASSVFAKTQDQRPSTTFCCQTIIPQLPNYNILF